MKSILDHKEVQRAQFGPRQLKNPRSREYAIQTLYALKRHAEVRKCDQERIDEELAKIKRYEHWKILGYADLDAMLDAELSELGGRNVRAAQAIKEAQPLAKHGEIGGGHSRVDNRSSARVKGGTSTSYLAARIKRDRPDIAARVEAGEFKSMRQAAIAAGIVKVPTGLDLLRAAWKKASAKERAQFLAEIKESKPVRKKKTRNGQPCLF